MDVSESARIHQFDNGLTLIAERMDWLESAAFTLLLPAGCSRDPADRAGLSNLLCEMVQRGCGDRDSRQFVEDLDNLGADRSASVSNAHGSFSAAIPAGKLYETLAIHADVVRRPLLPEDQLEDGRMACFQEIRSLEDDLPQKVFQELKRRRYPDPWGRSTQGTMESVAAITMEDLRQQFADVYRPDEAILSVAGNVDWDELKTQVERLFGDWSGTACPETELTPAAGGYQHIDCESSQTHIGVTWPSLAYSDPDYFLARGAIGVLSDGMSSRLFTEVREVRGLCYAVFASCHATRDLGSVFCYAGTSTERAQETLDVLLAEVQKLAAGIHDDELSRLKAKLKSSLVMQQESSVVRSGSNADDWHFLSRVRSPEEITQIINDLTTEKINSWLAANPPRDFTLVTLGANKLETCVEISSAHTE